jgi:hypothetical protein
MEDGRQGAAALRFLAVRWWGRRLMTAGLCGRGAADVGRGHMRASHADREQVIGILQAAFVQGRLTKDELDSRIGQAFGSRTYGELAAVTADLPARPTAAPPKPARAQARPPVRKIVTTCGCSPCLPWWWPVF